MFNELVDAADEKQLSKTIARYRRIDLMVLYKLGYMELDRRGAELLFQVLTEREEKSAVAIASNEPFSKAHMFARTCVGPRRNYTGCGRVRKARMSAVSMVICCPASSQVVTDASQESCRETRGRSVQRSST